MELLTSFFVLVSSSALVTTSSLPIDEIALDPLPPMTLTMTETGYSPVIYTGNYSITTNGENKKITAQLGTSLPEGVTLSLTLEAPEGGKTAGEVFLSKQPTLCAFSVSKIAKKNLKAVFTLRSDDTSLEGSHPITIFLKIGN